MSTKNKPTKMKKILSLTVLCLLFFSAINFSLAASNPKIYAVVQRADWCPVCKANGERIMNDVMSNYMGSNDVSFVMNDLTNDDTKSKTKTELQNLGIYDSISGIEGTGLIILVDANSKKVLKQISVKESTKKILKAINKASK